MVEFLKGIGITVEVHRDHFKQDEDDHIWIPTCAAHGWVIISGDQGLEKAALNVRAVTDSAAKIFILTDNNMKGIEWAASIITGREKMTRLVRDNDGPFYATVGKGNDTHVGRIRFVGRGKPKEKQQVIEAQIPVTGTAAEPPGQTDRPTPEPKLFS